MTTATGLSASRQRQATLSDTLPPKQHDDPLAAVTERLRGWNGRPVFEWAGLEIVHAVGGEATVILHVEAHHRGGGGSSAINGAIAAYLFDCSLGTASASLWGDDTVAQVTVTMSVQYLRPLHAERSVTAVARVVRRGASLVFVEGDLKDEADNVCATCSAIYRLFHLQPESAAVSSDSRDAAVRSSVSDSSR